MREILWNNARFDWNSNPYFWDNAVLEMGKAKDKRWKHDKDKKKRKQIIKLVMWRRGIKVYDEAKEIKKLELYIDDIKLIAEEIKKNVQIIHG